MSLDLELFQKLQQFPASEAWEAIFQYAWDVCSKPITGNAGAEVTRRDRQIADIDQFLTTAGWNLWRQYEDSVPLTSTTITNWWNQNSGKAILILDALSLREASWILEGAEKNSFTIHTAKATGAELPADTTPFARALGFSQRSSLENNGAGNSHKLSGAITESTHIPWQDCIDRIGSQPDLVFWHHWPDNRLHEHDNPGQGLTTLTQEAQKHLTSDVFWQFVSQLANGRKVIITADHGYAASGIFPDSDKDQTEYLKKTFRSGRCNSQQTEPGNFVPPIDLKIESVHGEHLYVNGRRKWKSAGGYPTLTHGGLSILEVAVPFIECSKAGNK
jgi:hypothetical protein